LARQANGISKNSRMIHELKQPSSSVLAIDCPFPEVLAIIEGNNPSWVFVDGLNTPTTVLVWAQGIKGFYLVGDANCAVFLEELCVSCLWLWGTSFHPHAAQPRFVRHHPLRKRVYFYAVLSISCYSKVR
jgi:hypothetical protein